MMISVIIPTYNRAGILKRTLDSVCNQTLCPDEIIIVDDNSIDNTREIVEECKSKCSISIKYIYNNSQLGGAISRNIGAEHANGKYIAFLDSDDEWKEYHLEKMMIFIKENELKGAYSYFITDNTRKKIEKVFAKINSNMSMISYIMQGVGDTRTSTFIFEKNAFNNIKFDPLLKKHQDWDLAIRFYSKYSFDLLQEANVILHIGANDRMSSKMNHEASELFLQKHREKMSNDDLKSFYYFLALSTLRKEGKNIYFKEYLNQFKYITKKDGKKNHKEKLVLSMPTIMIRLVDFVKYRF